MAQSKYQYFTIEELQCHGTSCCGGQQKMNHEFMVIVVAMRRELGFPFVITSAYRCPEHNSKISITGMNGVHTTGRAVDISCRGEKAYEVCECAIAHGMTGIGINQKGSNRFIHIDNLTGDLRPWIWSY